MNVSVGKASDRRAEDKQDRLRRLEADNLRLQKDNEMLLNTVATMRTTVNRLLERYVIEEAGR